MDNKLEQIWQLMNNNNFKFDRKFPADLICVLCKKILIDVRVSSCGCRFCKKCIEQYLATDDLICPGDSDECVEEMLNMERNVSINHFVNRKITKVKVQCPIETCSFVDQIMNMEEHVNMCRKQAGKCPYSEHGCNYASLDAGNISSHLNVDKDGHIEIIVRTIEGLKNQSEKMLKEIEFFSKESDSMKEEAKKTKALIDDLRRQLEEKDQTISSISTKEQLKSKYESQLKEIGLLKYDLDAYYKANAIEFVWEIRNYSLMATRNLPLYSEEFLVHANGTKFQLCSTYNYNKCYKISPKMSQGSYNDSDRRPMKCDINIGIVEPKTGKYFISQNKLSATVKTNDYDYYNLFQFQESDFSENLNSSLEVTVKCLIKIIH